MKGWQLSDIERLQSRGLKVEGIATPKLQKTVKVVRKPKQSEEDLQKQCVYLFRLRYPGLSKRFYAIPNGGKRNAVEAYKMKLTGTLAGVWDMFLSVPKRGYSGLYIEMKSVDGKLTQHQIEFMQANKNDYEFVICQTLEQFEKEVDNYLK